jgi:hypothetical protein
MCVFSWGMWGKMAELSGGRGAAYQASALIMAAMFGSMAVAGVALAESGETLSGVASATASTCQQLRNQFPTTPNPSNPFGGDVVLACYGNDSGGATPTCGVFSTGDAGGQTNQLTFCGDSFPSISVREPPVIKANVQVFGVVNGHVTGVTDGNKSSMVVCLSFAAGRQVCLKIDRRAPGDTTASDSFCPKSPPGPTNEQFFRVADANTSPFCTVLQGIVDANAGAASGPVAFGLFTDVFDSAPGGTDTDGVTLGEPLSQGLLVCPTHRATCATPGPAPQLKTAFSSGLQVISQIPIAQLNERPDCYLFRGRRIC